MSGIQRKIPVLLAALALALLFGACGGNGGQAAPFSAESGTHPADWLQTHWAEFIKSPDQCRSCHGSTTDPASAGGIARISCFTCHPNGPSHQAGWSNADQHGRRGAQAAPSPSAGFAYCAKCHGSTYDNPVGTSPSCLACHTKAPHPDRPWVGSSASAPSHVMTDAGNAPECFKCHANGAHSVLKPPIPAPVGTSPGCFNNTLCHGRSF